MAFNVLKPNENINRYMMMRRTNQYGGDSFIVGLPGSGKTAFAQQEIFSILNNTEDDVIIIDTCCSYDTFAESMTGDSISIDVKGSAHINPFDIEAEPETYMGMLAEKTIFWILLCSTQLGKEVCGLSEYQRNLLDRCIENIYEPYLNSYNKETKDYDKAKLPTMQELWQQLNWQSGYDAYFLAGLFETFVNGSLKVFNQQTNIEPTSRLTVYNLNVSSSMEICQMQMIVLENLFGRIKKNHEMGKKTWIFVENVGYMYQSEASAEFMRHFCELTKHFGVVFTGITQNVSTLLISEIGKKMVTDSAYVLMMKLSSVDQKQLADFLQLPETALPIYEALPGFTSILIENRHLFAFYDNSKESTGMLNFKDICLE